MANEKPGKKSEKGDAEDNKEAEAKKGEGTAASAAANEKADERAKNIINTVGEIFRSRSERIRKNKEAVGEMGKFRFGVNMLGAGIFLALAGSVALPFWGMKAILEADKYFMAGLKFFG